MCQPVHLQGDLGAVLLSSELYYDAALFLTNEALVPLNKSTMPTVWRAYLIVVQVFNLYIAMQNLLPCFLMDLEVSKLGLVDNDDDH